MKTLKIVDKNKKVIGYLAFYLNYPVRFTGKKRLIASLTRGVKKVYVGYAGFQNKKYLQTQLERQIFDKTEIVPQNLKPLFLDKKTVSRTIVETLKKCHQAIQSPQVYVFVFPSFSEFVKTKMFGVTGLSPWKNTILLFIHPKCRSTQKLSDTIAHEFAHAVTQNYHKWKTLLDSLVFEGITENFREEVVGGKPAPWAGVLIKDEAKKFFKKLKPTLYSENHSIYRRVFFGDKDYPLWAGYAIGYQVVKSFCRKNKRLSWKQIFQLKPHTILKGSDFT